MMVCMLNRCKPRRDPTVSITKQVAPGWALSGGALVCSSFWGVPLERIYHEHVLALFAWASGSFTCAEGSNRQHSRRDLLPLPILLPVSAE